jgi:hypothetical protein
MFKLFNGIIDTDPQRRELAVALGYQNLQGHNIATECKCASIGWVQEVKTNVEPQVRPPQGGDPVWYVDDTAGNLNPKQRGCIWTGAWKGHTGLVDDEFKKFIPQFNKFDTWLYDSPGRDIVSIVNRRKWDWDGISCLVCVDWSGMGVNWVILQSCVRWGIRVQVDQGKTTVPALEPAPTSGRLAPGEVEDLKRLLTAAQCPQAKPPKWLVDRCPPQIGNAK